MVEFIKTNLNLFIQGGIALLAMASFYVLIRKIINTAFYFITMISFIVIELVTIYFEYYFLMGFTSIILLAIILVITLGSQNVLKKFGVHGNHFNFFVKTKKKPVNDRSELIDELRDAVLSLSESKTGAIITIENNVRMDDYIREGVALNCPVKKELLTTIFYSGTPLHDGAVVIRDNTICAASVYYQPTTTALTGRYGARHRAALGISQATDSLTIVVSEETGRISFVQKGQLETVTRDRFPDILVDKLNHLN